jgi:sugar diacid utilization regulator
VTSRRRVTRDTVPAAATAGGPVPADYLAGYVDVLAAAAGTGRLPGAAELEHLRDLGGEAAEEQLSLRALIDAYLRATELAWDLLPGLSGAPTASEARTVGVAVLGAARRVVAALAEGHERSQQRAVRREDAVRREFVDDLLHGRGDLGHLAERAERFGVLLAGGHVAVVARATHQFSDGDDLTRRIESALVARFGARNVLLAARDGQLVAILPSSLRGAPGEFAHQVLTVLGTEAGWQVGVGRPHTGPSGVLRSYEEARNALHLADRLGFRAPVLHAADLLVFPVLLRDRAAIVDLVTTVLGPLADARGGPQPLLDTLTAFFNCQGNNTAAARQLKVSVRAVTYRLDRIRTLTGYAPTEPTQRFTLEAAVLGARLLGWPAQPLPEPN